MEEYKQVIVVNESLKLPRGKLAAQVAHAAVGAFLEANETARQAWLEAGMPKIVLAGTDQDDLLEYQQQAGRESIPACLIADSGRTVLAEGTITCLGLGPAPGSEIDQITGALRLL
jgi:PTH2 family peptidyl-tRNA hydrolase